MILISDGKANVSMGSGSPLDDAKEVAAHIRDAGISSFVIDSEQSFITFGLAHTLSDELGAKYLRLEDLQAEQIAGSRERNRDVNECPVTVCTVGLFS